jgi:uncharacterized repeat protein (TIGR01451 family)
MNVVAAGRTLTITEQPAGQVAHWQTAADIACTPARGSPGFTIPAGGRQVAATLDTDNSAGKCTVTNTKRARIALVANVPKRMVASDQFTVSVSGAGSTTLTNSANAAIAASAVTVATTGAATGNFTNPTNPTFRATPNQVLTLVDAMAGGSGSGISAYDTRLTCTNAYTGPGATPAASLPANAAVATYNLTPKPGDDITCTYTNTPRAKLTLAKTVVNDDGQSALASAWTLTATSASATISGVTGAAAVTAAIVPTGTYTLTEAGPAGYVRTGLACSGAADGNPADGLTLASGEVATCTFTNNDLPAGFSIVKSVLLSVDADGNGAVSVGDTLAYTVTVTNTGAVALTNVQISDPLLPSSNKTCATVAPGATCVLTGSHVVTPADAIAGQVSNTAQATSTQVPGPKLSNTLLTPVASVPLTIVKVGIVRWDPINGTSNPKAIPGAIVEYQIVVSNPAPYTVDNNSVVVTDPLPPRVQLSIADLGVAGSGPVEFDDGSHPSGLAYVFGSLASPSDDVEFSADHGAHWDYAPSDPDSDGLDPNVTDIRIKPKGAFNGNTTGNGANDAQFTLKFRVRVD